MAIVFLLQTSVAILLTADSATKTNFGASSDPPVQTVEDSLVDGARGDEFFDVDRLIDLHMEFADDDSDWFPQLADYYALGITLPARLTFEDQQMDKVGVRFKGASSYIFTPRTRKKSFDLNIGKTIKSQRLFGYKKFNLNNGFIDPTMVREVLFLEICRQYVPAARASLAQVSINDRNWGVYTVVQQIDRDFFEEWFPQGRGNTWRGILIPPRVAKPFVWLGEEVENYSRFYEQRSSRTDEAWADLIEVFRLLEELPVEQLESGLDRVFAIDNALWLIALENVFMDNDSFVRKGYDYFIFEEPRHKRMHLIQHDGNEAFGSASPGQWPSGVTTNLDPFFNLDNPDFPVISRLLSVPAIRQRYLAHMRTIIHEYLDWEVLSPRIERLQSLAGRGMKESVTTLYPLEMFGANVFSQWTSQTNFFVPGLKPFVEERRQYLLNHPDIALVPPTINSVTLANGTSDRSALPDETILIRAELGDEVGVADVFLHFAESPLAPFRRVPMFDDGRHEDGLAGDSVYGATIDSGSAGTKWSYYVEARADDEVGTTAFMPARAAHEFFVCEIKAPLAKSTQVVINEVVTSNKTGIRDPEGENEDWIELLNISSTSADLSGCFLSDDETEIRMWAFPSGTILQPGEHLVIWADAAEKSGLRHHANFKLSKNGETLLLVDSDRNGNSILNRIEISNLDNDVAFGRLPDGVGEFQQLLPTPWERNQ